MFLHSPILPPLDPYNSTLVNHKIHVNVPERSCEELGVATSNGDSSLAESLLMKAGACLEFPFCSHVQTQSLCTESQVICVVFAFLLMWSSET